MGQNCGGIAREIYPDTSYEMHEVNKVYFVDELKG
jgi:hypothetical protein